MSAICLIDTSVFMEILNVPGKASHHKKTADLCYFNWLTSGYNQWSRTTTTETQSARRTHRELYYSITHSKQLGTKTSSEHLQTNSEDQERLELIARPVREKRKVPRELMMKTILAVCNGDFLDLAALADLLDRSPDSLRIYYLNRMVKEGQLELRHPDKPTHPDQGYRAKNRIPEQEARK